MFDQTSTITAVLGPTNTGKTHYALERMLARRDGIIGLPLRLLAREIYDRLVQLRGPNAVSLITGEEKIAPPQARYHVATVEAMPLNLPVDFVAIDEIQLCADADRGHVFTDRLLHARGRYETLFLGSETIRPRIARLVPDAKFVRRERFSTLRWTGARKISRLKPRTAVVAFSVDQVYAIAELLRRQRGGAAVVMGALSPRTRNAQVALYQQGEVDYMVATDAIGMGLNMDVDHVAFAGVSKFDGWRHRPLLPHELAQIAGRAGRYTKDGSFGVTGEAAGLEPQVIDAIEDHRFKPLSKLMWRNTTLQFQSTDHLLASLDVAPEDEDLARSREADDQTVLRAVVDMPEVREIATRHDRVRLLWDVCQLPDFRKVSPAEHATLVSRIYRFLLDGAHCIPSDWLAGQVRRLDRADGDIDTLSRRLAYIRTWTYTANRAAWVEDEEHWRGETRAVEDRLSDALHDRLTRRFVDRRTSFLMRRLKQKEHLVAEVNDKGEVMAEGQYLGRMDGFRFTVDESATGGELKTLKSASLEALQTEFSKRADKLYLSPDTEIDVTDQGGLMWGTDAVGRIEKGDDPLSPKIKVFVDEMADASVTEKVERRLHHWMMRKKNALFEPLIAMRDDEAITGLARGVSFRLVENFGIIPRREIANDIKTLPQEDRAVLRKHGVRFGQHFIFMPALLKPAPTRLRLLLWALQNDMEELPEAPPPGHVTVQSVDGLPATYYPMAGYRRAGSRALRIDMLERLADLIRPMDARAGFEATQDMLSITGLTLEQFADLMAGLGYVAERGERKKTAKVPEPNAPGAPSPDQAVETDALGNPADPAEGAPADDNPVTGLEARDETALVDPADTSPPADAEEDRGSMGAPDTVLIAPEDGPEEEVAARDVTDPNQSLQGDVATLEKAIDEALIAGQDDGPEGKGPSDSNDKDDVEPEAAHENAADPETGGAAAPTESDEIEVYFSFRAKPRGRPLGRGDGRRARGKSEQPPDGAAETTQQDRPKRDAARRPPQEQTGRGNFAKGKTKGKGKGRKGKQDFQEKGPRRIEAGPKRERNEIDPDNPFAVLQQLKNR
ncbi:MAG: helicase-related protein [Pseudomonadota bacterium]